MSGLFKDSKQFVDMPTSKSKAIVLGNFAALPENSTSVMLQEFLAENFHRAGYEMRIVFPKDWSEKPKFLETIIDERMKNFATTVHSKWKTLLRRFDQRRICGECQASSLHLPYPFIVPGGRFREFYYWDSYWILEGLYVSEMCGTASGMIENMLAMIEEFGFIPNGARIYYLNRSQPPLFTQMAKRYLQVCLKTDEDRKEFLRRALPYLEKEHSYWMRERSAEISCKGRNFTLNVYRTEHWIPRPESFQEDRLSASSPAFDTELKRQLLYQNIAAAAESGWDFSGRWLNDTGQQLDGSSFGVETIKTVWLVPVDLNAIMYANEKSIAEFYQIVQDHEKEQVYRGKANVRKRAIQSVLFDSSNNSSIWRDFDLSTMKPANRRFYASDLAPLWFDFDLVGQSSANEIIHNHKKIIFEFPGGIPASEIVTGQQWDLPNVWAPLQQFYISVYLRLDQQSGIKGENYRKALNIAQRFINSTYCGYAIFGQLFEKYHASDVGYPGGGGEYVVQEGFGWTNGVILWIFDRFGSDLKVPMACSKLRNGSKVSIKFVKDEIGVKEEKGSKMFRYAAVLSNFVLTLAVWLHIK